jgi:hypothetical protein
MRSTLLRLSVLRLFYENPLDNSEFLGKYILMQQQVVIEKIRKTALAAGHLPPPH